MHNNIPRNLTIKSAFLVFIFVDIFNDFHINIALRILLCCLILIFILNELIINQVVNNQTLRYITLVFTILGAAVLYYLTNRTAEEVYLFLTLIDIYKINGKMQIYLAFLHAILFFTTFVLNNALYYNFQALQGAIFSIITSYVGISSLIFLFQSRKKEQIKLKKLNEELIETNKKLSEYSMKIEELAVSKERTRVAQELHDSLGHSLMALSMNLEFANKVFNTKPDKAKEILSKAEVITHDSINDLREAVRVLKEKREIKDLYESIMEMIDNFRLLSNIKINLDINYNVELLNPGVKNCIYTTVKEGITNSIKHGKSSEINIEIKKIPSKIKLIMSDNGIGCEEIINSNGLNGINDRITLLRGNVNYKSFKNKGFIIEINIPLRIEENEL